MYASHTRSWVIHGIPVVATATCAGCLGLLDDAMPIPTPSDHPLDSASLRLDINVRPNLSPPAWLKAENILLRSGPYVFLRADDDPAIYHDELGWSRLYRAERRIEVNGPPALASDPYGLTQLFILSLLPAALRMWDLWPIHACAVDWHGRALIFPAESGSGKSTLALALVRGGFKLLSDDMPIVQRTANGALRLLPFPEHSRVLPSSLAFFPELAHLREQAEQSGPKLRFDLTTIYPDAYAAESRPAAIVLPRIAHAATSVVEPCPPSEALTALMAGMAFGSTGASMAEALPVLGDLVNACGTYRLHTGTDFDDLPGLLRGLVEG